MTLFVLNPGILDVEATRGNSYVGGRDIDEAIVEHCAIKFKQDSGIDISKNEHAMNKLRLKCE